MKIIPINNGYFNYKSIDKKIFKSRLEKSLCNGVTTSCDTLTLDDGETYIVGEGDTNIDKDKTTNSKFTKILILNMLGKFINNTCTSETFNVLLSTPPGMYKNQVKALPSFLNGKYNVIHNNVPKEIIINNVKVYPETFIVYLNYQEKYKNKNLLIWDIGGFTTNVVLIRKGTFTVNDYITIPHGMYHLDEKISQYLSSKYLEQDFTIDDIQYLRDANDSIMFDEQPYIDELYNKHIEAIIKKIELKQWSYQIYENFCTGGGCKILFDNIRTKVNKVELSPDPLFDNLKALEKLAVKELK